MFNYCSTFTSEIFAIYQATLIAAKSIGKFCICSDSQSSIEAIQNFTNKSILVISIRDLLIKHSNKIKLMWVPGHCGIQGNEFADSVAKSLHNEPVLFYNALESSDLIRLIKQYVHNKTLLKWNGYSHHYASINPNRRKPVYSTETKHKDIIMFTRLRLGHTKITHGHLLNSGGASCSFCNSSRTSVKHILDECPHFNTIRQRIFGTALPSELLPNTNLSNINTISKFLLLCNVAHLI
ncbi:uncharacterized protein LOC111591639 [Ceratitis capitata]|uniref:uncharacterized protein LOC111591639 n=1 Tax=Ceratitis capitata TaxID=7213 RepID=UPI000C6C3DE7|nr:uncharacterized protein LOC111591639 [Ceratitis capitata]